MGLEKLGNRFVQPNWFGLAAVMLTGSALFALLVQVTGFCAVGKTAASVSVQLKSSVSARWIWEAKRQSTMPTVPLFCV